MIKDGGNPAYFKKQSNSLTELDRRNIDILCHLVDYPASGFRNKNTSFQEPDPVVKFGRDERLLSASGFSFGFTGDSMFGVDNEGYAWQVWRDVDGRRSKTVWRRSVTKNLLSSGWGAHEKGMTFSRFYQLFSKKQTKGEKSQHARS